MQYHSDAIHCTRMSRMMSPPAPLGAAIAMVIVPRIDNTTIVAGIHLRRANILFPNTHIHTNTHTHTHESVISPNATLHISLTHVSVSEYHTLSHAYLFACVRGPMCVCSHDMQTCMRIHKPPSTSRIRVICEFTVDYCVMMMSRIDRKIRVRAQRKRASCMSR